ncbi:AAA family ATPase [Nakamurella sp.]|uniref:AAA family ATPase n=1 Tax=Nakamurella sp. TaxID=1869182 RepID=UPI003B3B7BB3
MSQGLLTAGSGQGWENELVAALDRPGSPMTVLRRCVDIGDVLAVATTGQAAVAVVSADLRRLDTDAVTRLRSSGVAVVGVHPAGDENARARLVRIGITALVADDAGVDAVVAAARVAVAEIADLDRVEGVASFAAADPMAPLPPPGAGAEAEIADGPPPRGTVVAVWGPTGAPGRTLLATNLAVEAAGQGTPTLLIDADVYGGVVSSAFGLLDESPGLAGACRLAAGGRLDLGALAGLCWSLSDDLRLLTGIARADRWPEVRPSAIPLVLDAAREMAPLTVVDCGFALESDEELSFDTRAPRRNGATLTVLAEADVVLVVGSCDPPGLERLVRGLAELGEAVPDAVPRVVLNRCRSSVGSAAEAEAAVRRFAGVEVDARLPEDRAATDRAWRRGVALADAAPRSALRGAIGDLARSLTRLPVRGAR